MQLTTMEPHLISLYENKGTASSHTQTGTVLNPSLAPVSPFSLLSLFQFKQFHVSDVHRHYFFKIYLFVIVQVQLSPFSSHQASLPHPSPPPILYLPPLAKSICSLHMFLDAFPLFPPSSPLVTLSLSFISVSLVMFCLLVCFVD